MIVRVINFLVDYFTNINARKIFGGILAFVGLALIIMMVISGLANNNVLYAWYGICGILIGATGLAIINYDIAKDKIKSGHNALGTLTKALEQKGREEIKASAWNMNQESDTKDNLDSN